MKKLLSLAIVSLFALTAFVGCAPKTTDSAANASKQPSANASEAAAAPSVKTDPNAKQLVVNIGAQKAVTPFYLAKEKKWFEEEFQKHGATVNWVEVQGGPPQFDALLADRIDFFVTGNTPPIAAQNAQIPFKIVSMASTGQHNVGIVVHKDSAVKTMADLKGKKIAVAKATAAYDIMYRLLKANNVSIDDVEVIALQPTEAKAAYAGKTVDAWCVTEPFLSQTVADEGSTVLADAASIDYTSPAYYIGREKLLKSNPELATAFLTVLAKATNWQKENLDEAVKIYAQQVGLSEAAVRMVIEHVNFTLAPLDGKYQEGQQELAQFLFNEKAIDIVPKTADVTDNTFVNEALKKEPLK